MTRISIAIALALSCHVACSSSTNDTPSGASPTGPGNDVASCTVAARTGKSECQADAPPGFPKKAAITCSAGTVCVASSNYEASCESGCQSDENCGPSERCVRCSNSSRGSCRTCNISDADACGEKPKPDAGPTPVATCERNTFFDDDCTAPGKAFACPSTIEPTGQGTCAQTQTPGIWCCGGAVQSCKRDTFIDQAECSHPGPTGPRPPKGYSCDQGKEPSDPKCVQGDIASHWCCPS